MINKLPRTMRLSSLINKNSLFIVFTAILFCMSGFANSGNKQPGRSFNCAEIIGGIAKIICDSSELSQLDLAMEKAYIVAKKINSSIKHEQYLWLKQRNKCGGEKQQVCLKKSYLSRTKTLQLAIERGVKVPAGWEVFYLSGWIKVFNKICSTDQFDEVEQHDRLVYRARLNEISELLVLGCSFAANQDGHLVYLLTKYEDGVYAKQITFLRPFYQKGWKVDLAENITGSLKLYKKDQTFGVLRNYTAAGTCGYVVGYKISDLFKLKPLKPVRLKGEYDCDKGIVYESWPDIALPLTLVPAIGHQGW